MRLKNILPIEYGAPVGRNAISRILKHGVELALIIAACTEPAAAQIVEHGTYFLAGFTTDYAVVAIDSREIVSSVGVNDRYCKIRPLSDKAFFFSAGSTSARDNNTQVSIFDSRDIASSVYAQLGGDTSRLSEMIEMWAKRIEAIYGQHQLEFASHAAPDGTMAKGFFVGENPDGSIAVAERDITFQRLSLPHFADAPADIIPGTQDRYPLVTNGHPEIMGEFFGRGQTDRAKALMAKIGAAVGPDANAARYSAYVTAVRDWSGDPTIGGEIATIIMERGHNWRWHYRPAYCPEK